MPIEIAQSNSRVAEIRISCDRCGKLISVSVIPIAELQNKTRNVCQQCKEEIASSKTNRY
ncbi:MAG: hypothetical protein NWF05_07980 [Candidatus Bathyarchaeota archaeon]|nr:hypothetical protein [Candidatus Bathyarchaeota archaeon]